MLIDDRVPPSGDERPAVEPNWRVVGWLAAAAVLIFAAANASGLVSYVIVCATVYAVCRAAVVLVDYGAGLSEWHQ